MADNLTTQSGTPATVPSSSVIATDDVAGVHFQRVKLVDGTLDSNVGIAGDATNGLDVDVTRVQGTVTVGDGGSTLSVDDGGGSLTVDGTVAVSGSVAVTGPLTDTQLRATAVPVSGTFYQATQPVSGSVSVSNFPATQPVSGTVGVSGTVTVDGSSVTQPVSGSVSVSNLPATQSVSGSVSVSNFPASQAVTGTFWQATQPVSLTGQSVGISGTPTVTQTPATTGGLSSFRQIWAASTFPTNQVKNTGAGQVFGWIITNTSASPRYIKFYEKTINPTLASDTPKLTIMVPGNTSGSGMVAAEFTNGIAFSTGIALAVTTGISDTDTTAPSANEVIVHVFFK